MRVRRFIVGLTLIGAVLSGLATSAFAAEEPPAAGPNVPTPADVQAAIKSLIPAPPTIGVPQFDPNDPQLPSLPYVEVPPGLHPALGILSPLGVTVCQAGYLGPLVGVVALTAVFAALPQEPPVAPSFINPLFSPFNTVCVLAPFPKYKTCGADAQINEVLESGLPDIPSVGGLSVDVFSMVPAPFATVIGTLAAIQTDIQAYVLNNAAPPDITGPIVEQVGCSAD